MTPTSPVDRVAELEAQVQELRDMLLKERHAEPPKIYEPMIVFADGTNWNPGFGKGYYARIAGAWVKLGDQNPTDVWG